MAWLAPEPTLSSNGFNLSVNNVGPAFGATSFNGLPGITHTNSGNEGLTSAANNMNSANASFFFFLVGTFPGTGAGLLSVSYTDGAADFNSTQNIILDMGTNPSLGVFQDGTNTAANTSAGNFCQGVVMDGANITLYFGTTSQGSNSNTNTLGSSTSQIYAGFNNQNQPTNFTWGEYVITKNSASSGQRASLNIATSILIGVLHAKSQRYCTTWWCRRIR